MYKSFCGLGLEISLELGCCRLELPFPPLPSRPLSVYILPAKHISAPSMPPTFYDTHAHLDYPDFAAELPQVIERAAAAGITKIITIGTDLDSSARALKLADQFPAVFAAVGWH